MSGANWYFAKNNQQQGPIPEEELRKLLQSKELPGSSLVWTQGMGNWIAAKEVEKFADLFAAAAPAAPPPIPKEAEPVAEILAAAGEQAPKKTYAEGGFEVDPEQYEFQQPKLDDSKASGQAKPSAGDDAPLSVSAEAQSQSGRLRKMLSEAENAAPKPQAEPQTKWGDLDSIPTPGAGANKDSGSAGKSGLAAALDAIPTPGAGRSLDGLIATRRESDKRETDKRQPDRSGLAAQLDAIPTPGSARAQDNGSSEHGSLSAQLDAIATPNSGANRTPDNGSSDHGSLASQLDAIPAPGSARTQDNGSSDHGSLASQLDAIPTPGSARTQDNGSSDQGSLASQLDAIPTPNSGGNRSNSGDSGSTNKSGLSAQLSAKNNNDSGSISKSGLAGPLDAIPTPGSAKGNDVGSFDNSSLASQLDAIPTPGSAKSSHSVPIDRGRLSAELEAIRTPGAGLSDTLRAKREAIDPIPSGHSNLAAQLDAIPTPGSFRTEHASNDLLSQLDAIPTPGSGQGQTNPGDDVVVKPRRGLQDSERFRKLSQQNAAPPPAQVDTGSFVKGTSTGQVNRRTFSKLVPISRGKRPNPSEVPKPGDINYPHPWNRAWARCIDDELYRIPTAMLFLVAGSNPYGITGIGDLLVGFVKLIGFSFVGFLIKLGLEAVVLGKFGTSLGKRAFNIHLKDESTGEKIGMWLAMKRTMWLTLFSGWIVSAIPIVGSLITFGCCVWQYSELTTYGKSTWDAKLGIRYEHHPRDTRSNTMMVAAIGIIVAMQLFYLTVSLTNTMKMMNSTVNKALQSENNGAAPTQTPVTAPQPIKPQPAEPKPRHRKHQ